MLHSLDCHANKGTIRVCVYERETETEYVSNTIQEKSEGAKARVCRGVTFMTQWVINKRHQLNTGL